MVFFMGRILRPTFDRWEALYLRAFFQSLKNYPF
jgi:hypothetical protein